VCLETPVARATTQTSSVVAQQQANLPCRVVTKGKNGKPETAPCTSVFVTVPSPASAEDSCKIGGFRVWSWSWLKCNYGPVAAIASCCGAVIAFGIGLLAFGLNRNIRRGQIAHEQMKMLLEIDDTLIAHPELWTVHGPTYTPARPPQTFEQMVEQVSKSDEQKEAATRALAIVVSGKFDGIETGDFRKLAFLTRYLNFFEILYVNYRKRSFSRWRNATRWKTEEWRAWEYYIRDFFDKNEYAKAKWRALPSKKIFTASFVEFIEGIVDPKKA
jgi:hypothetical protein